MMVAKKKFAVAFKHGLHGPLEEVWADSKEEALKMAVAEYRRNAGFVETVSMLPPEEVVASVVEVGA